MITVTIKPAISMKKIILDTRHPALATPLNPKIPATIDSTRNITAIVTNRINIISYYILLHLTLTI